MIPSLLRAAADTHPLVLAAVLVALVVVLLGGLFLLLDYAVGRGLDDSPSRIVDPEASLRRAREETRERLLRMREAQRRGAAIR